ncbi:hypothetical protein HDV00_011177 [Rhizophlyctis rosea]|nr:hypothetical protein HDV00_011177 [Rhizophlyctis rosea]
MDPDVAATVACMGVNYGLIGTLLMTFPAKDLMTFHYGSTQQLAPWRLTATCITTFISIAFVSYSFIKGSVHCSRDLGRVSVGVKGIFAAQVLVTFTTAMKKLDLALHNTNNWLHHRLPTDARWQDHVRPSYRIVWTYLLPFLRYWILPVCSLALLAFSIAGSIILWQDAIFLPLSIHLHRFILAMAILLSISGLVLILNVNHAKPSKDEEEHEMIHPRTGRVMTVVHKEQRGCHLRLEIFAILGLIGVGVWLPAVINGDFVGKRAYIVSTISTVIHSIGKALQIA